MTTLITIVSAVEAHNNHVTTMDVYKYMTYSGHVVPTCNSLVKLGKRFMVSR